jgi:hypothetical protein
MMPPKGRHSTIFIMVIIASILPAQWTVDIGKHGSEVIMQEDSETIVITKPLKPMWAELNRARSELNFMKKITLESLTNNLDNSNNVKLRLAVLNSASKDLQSTLDRLESFKHYSDEGASRLEKRALEFLGDFLSTVTGVPSARDHRLVVEQIKAVRAENKGIENLLGQQNAENARILKRMHFHESNLNQLLTATTDMNVTIFRNSDEIEKAEALLSIVTKVNTLTALANSINWDIQMTFLASDSERLSRNSLSIPEISRYLTKIYRDRGNSEAPLFTKQDLDYYYREKLSHSWIDRESFALTTLLQIPIAQMGVKYQIHSLPPSETLHSGLPLCVTDSASQNYRFLSQSDYISCRDVDSIAICQKRKIMIFDSNCSSLFKCKPWQNTLVHDLTNSRIMFILENSTLATLDCTNKKPIQVQIPPRAIAKLNIHCSLEADKFLISKLTFRHMMDAENHYAISGLEFTSEKDLLLRDPKYEISKLAFETNETLESIIDDNQAFNETLNDFIRKSDRTWETLNAGAYPLEQILLWTMCGTNLLLLLILTAYIIKLHILVAKSGGSGGVAREDDQLKLLNITSRVMELEAQIQFGNVTEMRTSTPTDGEKPFNFSK